MWPFDAAYFLIFLLRHFRGLGLQISIKITYDKWISLIVDIIQIEINTYSKI